MNHIFAKLQSEMKEFLPNEEIRLDTNSISCDLRCFTRVQVYGRVCLDEAEFPVKKIGREKIVKGWSVTIWKCQPLGGHRLELVGNYRSEDKARLAFIKTIFKCKLSDYSEELWIDQETEKFYKEQNQM